jgi:hypothetical protein
LNEAPGAAPRARLAAHSIRFRLKEPRPMSKSILRSFGFLALLLPQVAGAQSFGVDNAYTAKFLCGFSPTGQESRVGVVGGHYNTIINVTAIRDKTAIAYRATPLSSTFDIEHGVPSIFSPRFDADTDEGFGIQCSDIKRGLLDIGGEGFIEGFVTIYSNRLLEVTDVLTAEKCPDGCDSIDAMQVYQVEAVRVRLKVEPAEQQ